MRITTTRARESADQLVGKAYASRRPSCCTVDQYTTRYANRSKAFTAGKHLPSTGLLVLSRPSLVPLILSGLNNAGRSIESLGEPASRRSVTRICGMTSAMANRSCVLHSTLASSQTEELCAAKNDRCNDV